MGLDTLRQHGHRNTAIGTVAGENGEASLKLAAAVQVHQWTDERDAAHMKLERPPMRVHRLIGNEQELTNLARIGTEY